MRRPLDVLDHLHRNSRDPMADIISHRLDRELEDMVHHQGHHLPAILLKDTAHNPVILLNNNRSRVTIQVQVDRPQDMDHRSRMVVMAGHRRTLLEAHQGIHRLARILRHHVATSDVKALGEIHFS